MCRSSARRRGFTLVEMLVVIGIIGVLAALLMGAVMMAVPATRRAAIVMELKQLEEGVEAYRKETGDYPPNFRDYDAFIRHVRRCYPKMTPGNLNTFVQRAWGTNYSVSSPPPAGTVPLIDEGESLVFWLASIHDDPQNPLGVTPPGTSAPFKKYFQFDEKRFTNDDGDAFPSYKAKYTKDTCYVYIDSRSYIECSYNTNLGDSSNSWAFAEDSTVPENRIRPYWTDTLANASATDNRLKFKPVNATSFQILCAGLDGDFGLYDGTDRSPADTNIKVFASGENYKDEDNDNIGHFSGGALGDKIP